MVAQAYDPGAYFARVRALGRRLNPAYPKAAIHWPNVLRDGLAFARLSWAMSVRYPELAKHYWGTLYDCMRHSPLSHQGVVRNMAHYMHLYPYSRFLIRTIEARIAAIDAGDWQAPEAMPAFVEAPPAVRMAAPASAAA